MGRLDGSGYDIVNGNLYLRPGAPGRDVGFGAVLALSAAKLNSVESAVSVLIASPRRVV